MTGMRRPLLSRFETFLTKSFWLTYFPRAPLLNDSAFYFNKRKSYSTIVE